MKSKCFEFRILVLFLAIAVGAAVFPVYAQKPKKNVLIVMADDFNYWNKLQGYYPLVKTPNLDKLSEKGVLFVDAQAAAPVCNPSRNALWSGMRPTTSGIEGNADGYIRTTPPFQNIITMNQYFMNHGYWAHGSGKLYHGNFRGEKSTTDYDNWSAKYEGGNGCSGGTFLNFQASAPEFSWSVNADAMSRNNCGDYDLAQEIASIITNYSKSVNKDKPFFIATGFARPHLPFNVPKQFYDLFKTSDLVTPKGYKLGDLDDTQEGTDPTFTELVTKGKWKEAIHMYIAALALSDFNAGIIFDALNNSEEKNNTIVVFMGDHGWHLGEKNRFGKATPWDLSNRTTLIIYDPAHINTTGAPKLCKKVVSLQDLYPTLIELAGLPIKTDIEGNSIAALIENPDNAAWDKPVIVSRVFDRVRTNKWSYARDRTNPAKNMLYDIENDPQEFDNLLHKDQKILPPQTVLAAQALLEKQLDSIVAIGLSIKKKLTDNYKFIPKQLSIPGKIEAEDYDEGGYSQTHYDGDKVNLGGKYRTADAMDIFTTDDATGLFHLKELAFGDWMNYSVADYLAGNYNINFRVKNSGGSPATIQIFNRDVILGELVIPPSTNNWTTLHVPKISLSNQNSIRLQIKIKSGSGVEFNYMELEFISATNTKITANINRKTLLNNVVTDGVLYLNLQSTDALPTLSIYNNRGKLVSKGTVPGEQKVAYTPKNRLKPGAYFLRIKDDHVASVERFIVK